MQRGTVEKFERIDSVFNFVYRRVECKRFGGYAVYYLGTYTGKKSAGNPLRHFYEAHVGKIVKENLRQLCNSFGHEQSSVGRKPACYGFRQFHG